MGFFDKLKEGVFAELIHRFAAAIPKLTFALLVLFIGWLIAQTLRKIIRRILSGTHVDDLTEKFNDIDLVQRSGIRVHVSNILAQMVFYVLMLGFVIFATDMLGIPAITQMVRDLVNYLPALFSAFVLFLIGLFLADMARTLVLTTLQSLGVSSAKLISSGIFYFLFLTVTISALSQAKVDTSFIASNLTVIIAAFALAFALGYGLAARDLVANYLAGHYNRGKVHIGDDVQISGVRGKVVLMDSTSLILQTPDRAIVLPLSKLTSEKVEIFYPDGQDDQLLEPGR